MTNSELVAAIAEFGLEGTAERLQLDQDIVERAAYGEASRLELAEIDRGFADYEIWELKSGERGELSQLEAVARDVAKLEFFSSDNWNTLRDMIVNGEVVTDQFEIFEHLSANLTSAQMDLVLDQVAENGADFLDILFEDGFEGYDFFADTEFWDWFRETFYSD